MDRRSVQRPTFAISCDLLCVESAGGPEFAFRLVSQSGTPGCGEGLVVVIWDDCVASYTKETCYDDGLQQRRQGGRKDMKTYSLSMEVSSKQIVGWAPRSGPGPIHMRLGEQLCFGISLRWPSGSLCLRNCYRYEAARVASAAPGVFYLLKMRYHIQYL